MALGPDKDLFVAEQSRVRRISRSGEVSTIAGDATSGSTDESGELVQFDKLTSIVHDGRSTMYVGDDSGCVHRIRSDAGRWSVSTLCDGELAQVGDLAIYDPGHLVATDPRNYRVVLLGVADGAVTVLAGCGFPGFRDGPVSVARFQGLAGLAVAGNGDIYLSDSTDEGPGARVRRIAVLEGTVSTIAGGIVQGSIDGVGHSAQFGWHEGNGIAVDGKGALVVADCDDAGVHSVRLIAATDDRTVTTAVVVAGPGIRPGSAGAVSFDIQGAVIDDVGGVVFADRNHHQIRRIDGLGLTPPRLARGSVAASGAVGASPMATPVICDADSRFGCQAGYTVSIVAGFGDQGYADGPAEAARFMSPWDVAVGPDGACYVADGVGNRIRMIAPDGTVSTVAGTGESGCDDGKGDVATFDGPSLIVHDGASALFVVEHPKGKLRRVTAADGEWHVSTLAGAAADLQVGGLTVDSAGRLIVVESKKHQVIRVARDGSTLEVIAGDGTRGKRDGPAAVAQFENLRSVAVGPGGDIYVTDGARVRRCTAAVADADADADAGNPANGVVTTIAGTGESEWRSGGFYLIDGPGALVEFQDFVPGGIAVANDGAVIVVEILCDGDVETSCVRRISPTDDHTVVTVVGGVEGFFTANGIAIDRDGSLVVADDGGKVRRIHGLCGPPPAKSGLAEDE